MRTLGDGSSSAPFYFVEERTGLTGIGYEPARIRRVERRAGWRWNRVQSRAAEWIEGSHASGFEIAVEEAGKKLGEAGCWLCLGCELRVVWRVGGSCGRPSAAERAAG